MPAQRPGVGARPLHFNFLDVFIGCSKSTFKDGGANYVIVHLPSFTTRLLVSWWRGAHVRKGSHKHIYWVYACLTNQL